jgi:hypothetical protein
MLKTIKCWKTLPTPDARSLLPSPDLVSEARRIKKTTLSAAEMSIVMTIQIAFSLPPAK